MSMPISQTKASPVVTSMPSIRVGSTGYFGSS
jgi:hypothetical protein